MSDPLDLERPLWQLYMVEGLNGRHAYISKTHHALVDGVAAIDVGTVLLDTSKRGTRIKLPEEPWEPALGPARRCCSVRPRSSESGNRCRRPGAPLAAP